VAGVGPEAMPQMHRPQSRGFPAVSPSHPSICPHQGILRITMEFTEDSRFSARTVEQTGNRLQLREAMTRGQHRVHATPPPGRNGSSRSCLTLNLFSPMARRPWLGSIPRALSHRLTLTGSCLLRRPTSNHACSNNRS